MKADKQAINERLLKLHEVLQDAMNTITEMMKFFDEDETPKSALADEMEALDSQYFELEKKSRECKRKFVMIEIDDQGPRRLRALFFDGLKNQGRSA